MNLKRLSDVEILAGLREGLSMSAEGLRKAAPYYVEARERGLDLSSFPSPILSYLPDVASGKLDPEILVLLGGFPAMAVAATLMPEDQQSILANDGKVQVLESTGKVRKARLAGLSSAELRQVIGSGRVRTPDEQKQHMPPPPTPRPAKPAVDPDDSDRLRTALTAEQWVQVKENAEKLGLTTAAYAVRCLVNYKWIKDKPVRVTRETRANLQAAWRRRGDNVEEQRKRQAAYEAAHNHAT